MRTRYWILLAVVLALLLAGLVLWEWAISQLRF